MGGLDGDASRPQHVLQVVEAHLFGLDLHPALRSPYRGVHLPESLEGLPGQVLRLDHHHLPIGDGGLQLGGGSQRHDLAFVDDGDPVRQGVGFLQVVGGEHDGLATLEVLDVLPDGSA